MKRMENDCWWTSDPKLDNITPSQSNQTAKGKLENLEILRRKHPSKNGRELFVHCTKLELAANTVNLKSALATDNLPCTDSHKFDAITTVVEQKYLGECQQNGNSRKTGETLTGLNVLITGKKLDNTINISLSNSDDSVNTEDILFSSGTGTSAGNVIVINENTTQSPFVDEPHKCTFENRGMNYSGKVHDSIGNDDCKEIPYSSTYSTKELKIGTSTFLEQSNSASDVDKITKELSPLPVLEPPLPLTEKSILSLDITSTNKQTPLASTSSFLDFTCQNDGNNEAEDQTTTEFTSYEAAKRKRLHSNISVLNGRRVKKRKISESKMVSFKGVTIYFFARKQSFITVPSQGGSTLGMSLKHNQCMRLSINEHKSLVAHRRKIAIKKHKRQLRLNRKVKELKHKYPGLENAQLLSMVMQTEPPEEQSSESSSSEEYFDNDNNCDEDNMRDHQDSYVFLQPIPTKARRHMLRMAGVQKIDSEEKLTNKLTRESREACGCDCEGVCNISYCQCAHSGVPCQVDRESFPCGCIASGCHNPCGRVAFDPVRVRDHFSHTMRKMNLEKTGVQSNGNDMKETEGKSRSPLSHKSPYVSLLPGSSVDSCFTSTASANLSSSRYCVDGSTLLPPNDDKFSLCYTDTMSNSGKDGECKASTRSSDGSISSLHKATSLFPRHASNGVETCNIFKSTNGSKYVAKKPVVSATVSNFLCIGTPSYGAMRVTGNMSQLNSGTTVSKSFVAPQNNLHNEDEAFTLNPTNSILPPVIPASACTSLETDAFCNPYVSCNELAVNSQSVNRVSSTPYKVDYTLETDSFDCNREPSPTRSRSSSLSDCGHDSAVDVKA